MTATREQEQYRRGGAGAETRGVTVGPHASELPIIGVYPAHEYAAVKSTLDALGRVCNVSFEPQRTERDRANVVCIGRVAQGLRPRRLLSVPSSSGWEPTVGKSELVTLDAELGPAIGGYVFREQSLPRGIRPLVPAERDVLAADGSGRALWTRRRHPWGTADESAVPISELAQGEVLRDKLRDGCFMGLLPLAAMARAVAAEDGWRSTPTAGCIVVDDPNLHRLSYGHLKLRDLVADAKRYGYHVALAQVPLDSWYADRRAAELVRRHPRQISLMVHGNDHVASEMGRIETGLAANHLAAQALRRISRFEARTRLHVQRVIAPPHGECSEEMADGLVRFGFEAMTVSRPMPWREHPPAERLDAGWTRATFVGRGLPIITRQRLASSWDDARLRAWLGQPPVFYGHHGDLADGPDVLRAVAEFSRTCGVTEAASPAAIARGLAEWRLRDGVLTVRPWSNRVELAVPPGPLRLRVADLAETPAPLELGTTGTKQHHLPAGEEVSIEGWRKVIITRLPTPVVDPDGVALRRPGLWPLARRFLVEVRDRSAPGLTRVRGGGR
jgi:hypothetical protein